MATPKKPVGKKAEEIEDPKPVGWPAYAVLSTILLIGALVARTVYSWDQIAGAVFVAGIIITALAAATQLGKGEELFLKFRILIAPLIIVLLGGGLGLWMLGGVVDHFDRSDYWYCWDTGDPDPHHEGHPVEGDHLCSKAELREAGMGE